MLTSTISQFRFGSEVANGPISPRPALLIRRSIAIFSLREPANQILNLGPVGKIGRPRVDGQVWIAGRKFLAQFFQSLSAAGDKHHGLRSCRQLPGQFAPDPGRSAGDKCATAIKFHRDFVRDRPLTGIWEVCTTNPGCHPSRHHGADSGGLLSGRPASRRSYPGVAKIRPRHAASQFHAWSTSANGRAANHPGANFRYAREPGVSPRSPSW